MHHTISDSSIQPTQRTSKSAPKFLPESLDKNVCQPLCIGSWAEPASWSPKHTSSGSRDIPVSPHISTARHTSSVLKSLKTQSDKITSKGNSILYSLVTDWVFPLKLSCRIESLGIWEHLIYVLSCLSVVTMGYSRDSLDVCFGDQLAGSMTWWTYA